MEQERESLATRTTPLAERIFAGEGEMALRTRTLDWSRTPLGPVGSWPPSLRTAVSICLGARHPIALWWGAERTMFYNDAYRSALGSEAHPRLLGRPGAECWPEIWSALGAKVDRVFATGESIASEDEPLEVRRNGSLEEVYFSFSFGPIRDDGGEVRGVLSTCTETTARVLEQRRAATLLRVADDNAADRARLEEQLRQAQKMEAVGRLAGGVAHDFNNMLSVVLSYAEILLDDLGPDDAARADVEEIRTAGVRAADLTRQLLAFSRQQVLAPKVLDLNQSIVGIEKMIHRVLGSGVVLKTHLASGLGSVLADPGQIEQIVVSLAVNARDAMPKGGTVTITTANVEIDEAHARAHHEVRPGPYVMLEVTDSGAGIDEEARIRIFEPFFTTRERRTGAGTGLGLAPVFGIVKQSGGHIGVTSGPRSGTAFKVYLPRTKGASGASASERPGVESIRGSETILLVEDDDQVLAVARNILRRSGYVVLEAENAGEALLICEQHRSKIHLLVTDVALPRMSGRQLAERLATLRPGMGVLFLSGHTDDPVLQQDALDAGVAYLQKPFTPSSLKSKVRDVLLEGRKELGGAMPARDPA
jgi:signal transduction histidine kinase/CheY-like chemotaxis protein